MVEIVPRVRQPKARITSSAHGARGLRCCSAKICRVPSLQVDCFHELYGLVPIGTAEGVSVQFYALSIERKIKHPAVAAIVQNASSRWGRRTDRLPGGRRSAY